MSIYYNTKSQKDNYYRKILEFLFLSGIIIGPFVFWPWAEVEFEIPKVWFTNRWIEILATFGIIASPLILKKEKIDTTLVTIVFAFFFQAIFSSFLGVDLDKSLAGNYFRGDGIFTLLHLVILFLVVTIFISKKLISKTIFFLHTLLFFFPFG